MGNDTASLKTKPFEMNKVFQTNFDRLVSAIKPAVGEVARKAYQSNLITRQNLSDAENLMLPLDYRASALLRHIFDRIEANEAHFHTFISILQDVPILMDLACDIRSILCTTTTTNSPVTSSKSKRKKKKKSGVKFSDISHKESWSSSELPANIMSRSENATVLSNQHHRHDGTYDLNDTMVTSSIEFAHNDITQSSKTGLGTKTQTNTGRIMVPRKISLNSAGESVPSSYESTLVLSSVGAYKGLSDSESCQIDSIAPFQCGCGEQCSLNSFVKGRCQQQSFPYLKLEHLSKKDREKLVRKLTSDAQEMIDIFAQLVCDTFDSLDKREIPVEKLRANTLTFGQQKLPKPYLDDHIQKLASASTVRDIQLFLVGYKYISFFNYGILQKIINHYGTMEDKQKLGDYLLKFSCFCKRSVFEVPSTIIEQLAPDSEIDQVLIVKVSEHLWFSTKSYFTMEDLYAVEQSIARIVGLDSSYILLRDINEGCVELTFAIMSETEVLPFTIPQLVQLMEIGINVITDQNSRYILPSTRPSCSHTLNSSHVSRDNACTGMINAPSPAMLTKLPASYQDSKQPVTELTPLIELPEKLDYTCLDRCSRPVSTSSSQLIVISNDGIEAKEVYNPSTTDTPAFSTNHERNHGISVETSLGYCSIESSILRRESDISLATAYNFSPLYSNDGYVSAPSSGLSTPVTNLSPSFTTNEGRTVVLANRNLPHPQCFRLPVAFETDHDRLIC